METKKYQYGDEDVVMIISRDYLEADLASRESALVNDEGELDDQTFDMLHQEILENHAGFLADSYKAVEVRVAREKRNENAEKENPHYRVYWKNENAYQQEFKKIKAYSNLSDARVFIHDGVYHGIEDKFKILEVKDDVEGDKDYAF